MKPVITQSKIIKNIQYAVVTGFVLTLLACADSGEGVNPGLVEIPLVYAKKTIPVDDEGLPVQFDVRDPLLFSAGGDVFIRMIASSSVAERNITRSITGGTGDVRDLDVSYDGKRVIFSLRLVDPTPNTDDRGDPRWNIYEYDIENDAVRRILSNDIEALLGNDIAPYYLPDGRIVFSSDRQTQTRALLNDEDKKGFSAIIERGNGNNAVQALLLHVMEADGSNIHQISFNQSHDLDPVVLPDGRILFSRWEGAGPSDTINLFTINPDGSELELYYGDKNISHRDANNDFIQLTQPRVMRDGRVLVLARPNTNTFAGGDLLIINGQDYVESDKSIFSQLGILNGPAQKKATVTNVLSTGISRAGRYSSAFPLLDGSNRLLVSKGTCQVTTDDIEAPNVVVRLHPCIEPYISSPTVTEMPNSYGLWVYDLGKNSERPIIAPELGFILTDVVVAQPQQRPLVIPDKGFNELNANLILEKVGILDIRSVYDMGAGAFNCSFNVKTCSFATLSALSAPAVPASARPARFLRIVKPVSLPIDNDVEYEDTDPMPNLEGSDFGPLRDLGMREIVGYTMIEPDGSVRVKVPANTAFAIEVLDEFGRRLGRRHDSWLQVRPGDTLKCDGCHQATDTTISHGRKNSQAASINIGLLADGEEIVNTMIPGSMSAQMYYGNYMDTLAQVRTRLDPAALEPKRDVVYNDVWTVPVVSPTPILNPDINYLYADLTITPPALSFGCVLQPYLCRTVINYVEHIQPIWEAARPSGICVSCHNPQAVVNSVPNADLQLNLSGTVSTAEPDHVIAYRELLFPSTTQEFRGGQVRNLQRPVLDINGIQVVDINGMPVFEDDPDAVDAVPASMSAAGARASYFIAKLVNTPDLTLNTGRTVTGLPHTNFLTDAELRLISEWLDLGAQYYNNPFDVPQP